MDLADFLLARIAEDEEAARAATRGFDTAEWTNDGGIYAGHPTREVVDYVREDTGEHIARWDPARVLAEADAKRRIVELIKYPCDGPHYEVLQEMGAIYADHTDYQPEWKP